MLELRAARAARPGLRRQHPDAGPTLDVGRADRRTASRSPRSTGRRGRPPGRAGDHPAAGRPDPHPPRRSEEEHAASDVWTRSASRSPTCGSPTSTRRWRPLRGLLADHGVLVLPGQDVDDAAFLAFLRGLRRSWPSRRARRRCRDSRTSTWSATSDGRRRRAAVPRRHQLRPPAARVHGAARRADPRARRGRRCSPTSTGRTRPCPPRCGSGCAGRTIRHVVTGVRLGADDETAAEHPVFRPHPLSGRTALYLSTPKRCVAISGMEPAEAQEMVEFLYRALHARGQPLPARVVAGRRRDVGQRVRPAPGRPRRRRRRPGHAPRHGRRGYAAGRDPATHEDPGGARARCWSLCRSTSR